MASIAAPTPTPSLTYTQEWLLTHTGRINLSSHGAMMLFRNSVSSIVKFEPLLKKSGLTESGPYWVYKSVITCYEKEPERFVVSIRITPPKKNEQENHDLKSEEAKKVQAEWDKIMNQKICSYIMRPISFASNPKESFKEKIKFWITENHQISPDLVKVTKVPIDPGAPSSKSPPTLLQTIELTEVLSPELDPADEKKESKQPQPPR